jgi:enamine deaminase RidA (YjgF/YER057c/UK114 family)
LRAAVRLGDLVYVSGTTATYKEGTMVGVADSYLQTIQIVKNIEMALQAVNASLKDVVRTPICVADVNNWKKVGQEHAKFFKQIRPAATSVYFIA